ncbi:MAG: methyltransferase [Candidatus Omnitrophica bacterium]|nr:methyltransferase [Candidatus Omnitrophota bacterium]
MSIPSKYHYSIILSMTFVLAACSLLYELLLAQTISFLASHTVMWYSLTIGIYIAAMGWGAFWCERVVGRFEQSVLLLRVEFALCALGSLSVCVIYFFHLWASYFWINGIMVGLYAIPFFLAYLFFVVSIGVLSGWEFPLLMKMAQDIKDDERVVNKILAMDYFGSLTAGLIFPLVLLPHCELITIGFITALINLLIAGLIYFCYAKPHLKKFYGRLLAGLGLFLLFCFIRLDAVHQYFLQKFYYYEEQMETLADVLKPMKGFPAVERVSSAYQKIDLVRSPSMPSPFGELIEIYSRKYQQQPRLPRDYVLYIDGIFQFWTNFEELYHEYFAHIPVVLNDQVPESVLILGAGDGLLLREIIKYQQVKRITLVDIDAMVVEWAQTHPVMAQTNQNAFDDPRVRVLIEDAYQFVRRTDEKYDAIYMDFPAPENYHISKLYSREFYTFVRKSLKPDGYVVLDAPFLAMKGNTSALARDPFDADWLVYYHTIKAAGFQTVKPFFTRLENDQPQALKILKDQIGDAHRLIVREANMGGARQQKEIIGADNIARHMLGDFVNDYTQRFVMLRADSRDLNMVYKDFGITFDVLDKKRFELSVSGPQGQDFQQTLNKKYLNSVMRPVIPDLSNWYTLKIIY